MTLIEVGGFKFQDSIIRARMVNRKFDDNLTIYATSDYNAMRCFLTPDGKSGFAISKEGELVNLFSLVGGRGADLVQAAIQEGATKLDCFDGYLVRLYSGFGFQEYRREPNWTEGQPDVVYMRRS